MISIPIIDIFAGPGGLGEGFSAFSTRGGERPFRIHLSIEKDAAAHRTLHLRSFFRSFGASVPGAYYEYLRGQITRDAFLSDPHFSDNRNHADREAWHQTLAPDTHKDINRRIRYALKGANEWVLIGGPPCQAYSVAGRSRMRSSNPKKFEKDERHFLYREYLRIIAEHAPTVFVMENVKGLLSSTIGGNSMFQRIIDDLSRPNGGSLRYRVVPLGPTSDLFDPDPKDFILKSENFGIPQSRHRVFLCGIRDDFPGEPNPLQSGPQFRIEDALIGLPRLRSRLSQEKDSRGAWLDTLDEACARMRKVGGNDAKDIAIEMRRSFREAKSLASTGAAFTESEICSAPPRSAPLRNWYFDKRLGGFTGHESRSHMRTDLHRYLFAASFAKIRGESARISDFPRFLLPKHGNVSSNTKNTPFADRFKVQQYGRPATTIVSHIAKDGHYFIHPDPAQCRSLTLREAARIQTFPDNYHFEGNRTQQYMQVGNAVPPLLAVQIAAAVRELLQRNRKD